MTGFDAFAILVILASAAAGWVRGAAREIITLFSFVLSAFLALISLPLTARLGRALIDADWAGVVFSAVLTFLILYFGIRILGSTLSKQAQAHPHLGGVDRGLGVVVGMARACLLLGAVHLVIVAAMPGERTPRWLSEATLRPVSATAARMIQIILPGIGRGADALTPIVDSSVRRGFSDDEAPPKSDRFSDKALPKPQSDNTSPPTAPR